MNRHKHIAILHIVFAFFNLMTFDNSMTSFLGILLNCFAAFVLYDEKPWGLDLSFGMFGISSLACLAFCFYFLMLRFVPELILDGLTKSNSLFLIMALCSAILGYLLILPIKYLKNKDTYEIFKKKLPKTNKVFAE